MCDVDVVAKEIAGAACAGLSQESLVRLKHLEDANQSEKCLVVKGLSIKRSNRRQSEDPVIVYQESGKYGEYLSERLLSLCGLVKRRQCWYLPLSDLGGL